MNSFLWPLLSKKETRVAELLLEGCNNTDISKVLGINIQTVKEHLRIMYSKAGLYDTSKIKRICLAVALYRDWEQKETENAGIK